MGLLSSHIEYKRRKKKSATFFFSINSSWKHTPQEVIRKVDEPKICTVLSLALAVPFLSMYVSIVLVLKIHITMLPDPICRFF